jgi:hypothetical protein
MPNIKVSDLPAVSAMTGDELVHVVQGGVSKKAAASALVRRDHAAIFIYDGAYAQSVPNGSTPAKLTHFAQAGGADSHADGMVADAANSQLIAGADGHYLVQYTLSYTCNQNNVTWEAYAFVAGLQGQASGAMSKLATGADTQCISGVAIVEMLQGQALDLRMYHNYGSAVNLTVSHASLVALFLHD